MFPNDKDLLWPIIYRRAQNWEQSFVLQHSGLQPWLIDIRDALTDSQGLHTVSCEDLEVQIRYILFLLGRYATKGSSLLQACFEQPLAPYRPFGVGASVALICYAFRGISTNHLRAYESKEIWARDETFFFIMLDQLKKSPIFSSELSVGELQAILLDLQRAFHNEEIRVASVSAQEINIRNRAEVINYYTQAFQVLDPFLLPKISLDALGIKPPENCSHLHLATLLATVFYDRHPIQSLNENFKNIPGIMLSKPDRVVVTEMFHVKAWQERWWNGSSDKFYVSVFHVAPGPETKTQSG
ncbi:uncharacterized protein N7469_002062 [Penicillium citrinum]|uniref:Uncharacterized protein n=1 Tax=Penicillium citrinum TaxID=5077 RepID=A0A9W9TT72_PENCI|nr:uncharacterized protein N7469_002062 [Penicillium citrinum]KAJ5240471.1 hypothetical protein N7469_002062 [Penicillium citrinum]